MLKIDAHQHFWRYHAAEYGWMGPGMERLKRDHLPGELRALQAPLGIAGTVTVQARQTLEETRWLLALAERHHTIRGVVGWVDLRSPEPEAQLEGFAAHPRLCGVRHVVHDEPDDRFLLREDVMRGIGALARYGLTYDLLLFPRHLPVARELAARYPEQPFVLDHIAKPPIAAGELEPWRSDLQALARCPNVCCKVSGMVTEADWTGWTPADFEPYLDVALEAFGAQRLMIGSDWPVCTVAGAYRDVIGLAADYVARLSEGEQAALWGETAARFYGLEDM